MDIAADVLTQLDKAQEALNSTTSQAILPPIVAQRMRWLEAQLKNIIVYLQALLADAESGLSISSGQGMSDGDVQDMLGQIAADISNLKSMIQTQRMLAR